MDHKVIRDKVIKHSLRLIDTGVHSNNAVVVNMGGDAINII